MKYFGGRQDVKGSSNYSLKTTAVDLVRPRFIVGVQLTEANVVVDMNLLIEVPILPKDIPSLNALLITHDDNDHFSKPICHDVKNICKEYHAPQFVAELLRKEGLNGIGHDIGGTFSVGNINITLTPDGKIWLSGYSRLLKEHLEMLPLDLIFLDFAYNNRHITFDGAVVNPQRIYAFAPVEKFILSFHHYLR